MDYAATTFVKPEVLEAMQPYFSQMFANPTGMYESGRQARRALEEARETVAKELNAAARREVYFTSGGTESDNWAIRGIARASRRGKHIITSAVEHHAVLETCEGLQSEGYEVTFLPVDEYGMVSAVDVKNAIRHDTALVSVIYANHEVGTINPIEEIGSVTRAADVLLHVDAVAAAGQLPLDVRLLQVDALSLSAHKFYGPKGVGALYVRDTVPLAKLMKGGAQQREKRAGTEDVASAVGLARALELANTGMAEENERLMHLRNTMREQLGGCVRLTGHQADRLPGHLSMLTGIKSEAALVHMDKAGVECSAGASCAAGSLEPSHILLAMGISKQDARTALRFTLGAGTTENDIQYAVQVLADLFEKLQKKSKE